MTRTEYMGLTDEQAAKSREEHGANIYQRAKRKSFMRHILDNLKDPIIRILIAAMFVNLIFTFRNINWAENIGIVTAIAVSTVVSALSERGSEKAFEKIREEEKKYTVQVLRNGKPATLCSEDLVVGDCILLFAGGRIPADAELIEGSLRVDQSAINGEAKPAKKTPGGKKNERDLYAGSLIVEGEGKAIVRSVGERSVYGQIAREIQNESEASPLKKRLTKLASAITKIGYAAAAIVALTYLFNTFVIDSNFDRVLILQKLTNLRFTAMHLIKAVTIAVTVIVVAVPEGLPMMISVILSSNMKKMTKNNVLVRKPVGIETAGCMNILFTDKTGTLTTGAPVVSACIFADGERFDGKRKLDETTRKLLDLSLHANSSVVRSGEKTAGGNGTERALFEFMKQEERAQIINKIPFDSKRKYSSCTLIFEGKKLTLCKGAPELILEKCGTCLIKGTVRSLDKQEIALIVKKLSKEGKRILALSYRSGEYSSEMPDNMVFLAIAVLTDGLRASAKDAVRDLETAGVHTVMITGDALETAESVARECGMIREGSIVIDGKDLSNKTDSWIKKHIDDIAVVARAMPNDKNRLVRLCREKGLIVGMTGDGVNDAPALKNADVGFAMGSGSEIAKEAGDIIILDNDLKSIVQALLYGRTIFKSIRKFITFQLIMNVCAVGITLLGQTLGIDQPVTVLQMLWVNMIMDTLGGLAFAGEQPMRFYLKERPITREEPILTLQMIVQILIMGAYGLTMCALMLTNKVLRWVYLFSIDQTPLLTAFFALFIFTGVAICFTARSERINICKGLFKNKTFLWIMALIVVIQITILYNGGKTFRCAGMNLTTAVMTACAALTVFPVDFVRRIVTKTVIGLLEKSKRKKNAVRRNSAKAAARSGG